jgi:hypothetical protein
MKRLLFTFVSMLFLVGCATSKPEAKVPHKKSRTVVSQSKAPVSYDSNGNPFLQVNGERIGVDFDANLRDGETATEFLVTQSMDQNGRMLVEFDKVAPPAEHP